MKAIRDAMQLMPAPTLDASATDTEQPICETCGGAGWVFVRAPGLVDKRWDKGETGPCPAPGCAVAEQNRQRRYARLVEKASLPASQEGMTFARWQQLAKAPEWMAGKWDAYGAALAFVQAVLEGRGWSLNDAALNAGFDPTEGDDMKRKSLVLSGVNGVGKTSLAAAASNALLSAHKVVLYTRLNDLLDAMRERFDRTSKGDYEYDFGDTDVAVLRTFQDAPVLVLDEFNLQQISDWSKGRIEQLVRYRYNKDLPTLITTNVGYDQMVEKYGAVVAHAVHGMAHWIEMSGYELRRRDGARQSR
jgi:DNA replication protein DnaC